MKTNLNVGDILKKIFKRWYVVLGMALLFTACVYIAQELLLEKQYESKVELLVLPKKNDKSVESSDANIRLNIQLMNTYMNIMKSHSTLAAVKKNLRLENSVNSLKKGIELSSDENSLSINLVVTNDSPNKTKNIANEIAKVYKNDMHRYFPNNSVSVLNIANVGTQVSHKIYYVVAVFLGLWSGIILVLIEVLGARVIRDEEDLKQFGFPVFGSVAYIKKERRK